MGGETLYGLAASAGSGSTPGFNGVSFHSHSSTFRYSFDGTNHSATTAPAAALELVLVKLGGIPALLAVRKDEAKLRLDAQLAADDSPRVRSLWAVVTALPKGGETLHGLAASAQSGSTSGFQGVSFHSQRSNFRYSFQGTQRSATTAPAAALELVLVKLGGIPALLAFNEANKA